MAQMTEWIDRCMHARYSPSSWRAGGRAAELQTVVVRRREHDGASPPDILNRRRHCFSLILHKGDSLSRSGILLLPRSHGCRHRRVGEGESRWNNRPPTTTVFSLLSLLLCLAAALPSFCRTIFRVRARTRDSLAVAAGDYKEPSMTAAAVKRSLRARHTRIRLCI